VRVPTAPARALTSPVPGRGGLWLGTGSGGVGHPLAVGRAAVAEPGEEPGEEPASGTDDGLLAVVVQCRVSPLGEEAS
jgi:hypothetical protein